MPQLQIPQTYRFGVVVKPAGDGWACSCPALEKHGAFTLGASREEALYEMQKAVQRIVEILAREQRPIPRESAGEIIFSPSTYFVAATLY
jgi:predicted RNase H-like HicB family nuclease